MTDNHPITPPPELVEQWCHKWTTANGDFGPYLATKAARWGADTELEACVEWLLIANTNPKWALALQEARRPKPPSLKEQAQAVLDAADDVMKEWPPTWERSIAAALRAAALILQEAYANEVYPCHPDDFLLDLATELEGGK